MQPVVYGAQAVSRILRLPCECPDPVPEAGDGTIIAYYGGWELETLAERIGEQKMRVGFNGKWAVEPGYYRILLPVPRSEGQILQDQVRHLKKIRPAWQPAPIVVAATALAVHLLETGSDLLRGSWCRCLEPVPSMYDVYGPYGAYGAGLQVEDGRIRIASFWQHGRDGRLCLAAAQRVHPGVAA